MSEARPMSTGELVGGVENPHRRWTSRLGKTFVGRERESVAVGRSASPFESANLQRLARRGAERRPCSGALWA
jgi:hypothetical protein